MPKKITKKIISKTATSKAVHVRESSDDIKKPAEQEFAKGAKTKKVCFFCQSKTLPSYTDIVNLRRYITDRAKIVSHLRNSLCSKHQRAVAKQIKYARHLALLPFTPKV